MQNDFITSPFFTKWLLEQQISLVCSTYQADKLIMLGVQDDCTLSIVDRSFDRPMGLYIKNQSLYMSSLFQLWRFENILEEGGRHEGYDRMYLPKISYVTGEVDVHDIGLDPDERPIFVNTLFSCLATVSETHSFIPLWKPPFISELAPEDRCHLNGMALDPETQCPKYVTLVSQSDTPMGWRCCREASGAVFDIDTDEVIISGLSMPHSPRIHNRKLWVLNSGEGYLGYIDEGGFKKVAFCLGFARGLALIGHYAVVAISLPRSDKTFAGLPLEEEIQHRKVKPFCGILIIDLNKGLVVHWLRIEGTIKELYDVAVIVGATRPAVLGTKTEEIQRTIRIGQWRDK